MTYTWPVKTHQTFLFPLCRIFSHSTPKWEIGMSGGETTEIHVPCCWDTKPTQSTSFLGTSMKICLFSLHIQFFKIRRSLYSFFMLLEESRYSSKPGRLRYSRKCDICHHQTCITWFACQKWTVCWKTTYFCASNGHTTFIPARGNLLYSFLSQGMCWIEEFLLQNDWIPNPSVSHTCSQKGSWLCRLSITWPAGHPWYPRFF
jgi:hypothetical protein